MNDLADPMIIARSHTVEAATEQWWQRLLASYPRLASASCPSVEWMERGSSAGRANLTRWSVAFNRPMLARDDGYRTILPETVVHELAHLAAFHLFTSRGHDPAWRSVMARMGFAAQRTHDLDVTGLPGVQRRWRYRCSCGVLYLTTTRHNRIQRGAAIYYCNRCHDPLTRAPEEEECA